MQDIALVIFAFVLSWSISVLFHCKASSALNTYNVAKRGMSKCQLFKHVHLEHVTITIYYLSTELVLPHLHQALVATSFEVQQHLTDVLSIWKTHCQWTRRLNLLKILCHRIEELLGLP